MGVVESMWVSVTNWSTPTVLFCILNLTIGTIFISSRFRTSCGKEKHEKHEHGSDAFLGTGGTSAPLLFRAPSTLLERVKSINFSFQYRSSDQAPDPLLFPQHNADSSGEDRGEQHQHRQEHEDEDGEEARELHSESHNVTRRSQSETSVAVVPKTAAAEKRKMKMMMKKSASEKMVTLEKEKEEKEEADVVDRRRPATTRERNKPTNVVVDEAVDEKADDFINRFRQQLKLQRLESILRYKEMLNRGAGR